MKDLLLNVGSGGGAAVAATGGAGGAVPAGGADAAEEKEEEKEEGTHIGHDLLAYHASKPTANAHCREGRVRRGHGFRSLRLSEKLSCHPSSFACLNSRRISILLHLAWAGVLSWKRVSWVYENTSSHVLDIIERTTTDDVQGCSIMTLGIERHLYELASSLAMDGPMRNFAHGTTLSSYLPLYPVHERNAPISMTELLL